MFSIFARFVMRQSIANAPAPVSPSSITGLSVANVPAPVSYSNTRKRDRTAFEADSLIPPTGCERCFKRPRLPARIKRIVQPERRATRITKYTSYRKHFLLAHEEMRLNKGMDSIRKTVRQLKGVGGFPRHECLNLSIKLKLGTSLLVRQWQAFMQRQKLEQQQRPEEQWRLEQQQILEQRQMLNKQRMLVHQQMLANRQLLAHQHVAANTSSLAFPVTPSPIHEQAEAMEISSTPPSLFQSSDSSASIFSSVSGSGTPRTATSCSAPITASASIRVASAFGPMRVTPSSVMRPTPLPVEAVLSSVQSALNPTPSPPSTTVAAQFTEPWSSQSAQSTTEVAQMVAEEAVREQSRTMTLIEPLAVGTSSRRSTTEEDEGLRSSADEANALSSHTSLSSAEDDNIEIEERVVLGKAGEDFEDMTAPSTPKQQQPCPLTTIDDDEGHAEPDARAENDLSDQAGSGAPSSGHEYLPVQEASMNTEDDWEPDHDKSKNKKNTMSSGHQNHDGNGHGINVGGDENDDDDSDASDDSDPSDDDDEDPNPASKLDKGKGKMLESPVEETMGRESSPPFYEDWHNSQRNHDRHARQSSDTKPFTPYVFSRTATNEPEEKVGSLGNNISLAKELDDIGQSAGMQAQGFFFDTQGDDLAAVLAANIRAVQAQEDKEREDELAGQMAEQYIEGDEGAEQGNNDNRRSSALSPGEIEDKDEDIGEEYRDDDYDAESEWDEEYDEPDRY